MTEFLIGLVLGLAGGWFARRWVNKGGLDGLRAKVRAWVRGL